MYTMWFLEFLVYTIVALSFLQQLYNCVQICNHQRKSFRNFRIEFFAKQLPGIFYDIFTTLLFKGHITLIPILVSFYCRYLCGESFKS